MIICDWSPSEEQIKEIKKMRKNMEISDERAEPCKFKRYSKYNKELEKLRSLANKYEVSYKEDNELFGRCKKKLLESLEEFDQAFEGESSKKLIMEVYKDLTLLKMEVDQHLGN